MTGYLTPVVNSPGLFYPNPTMEPTGDGNFYPGDLIPYDATSWLVQVFQNTVSALTYIAPFNGYGPQVEVVVNQIPPVAVTVTVWRHAGGRQSEVRGGVNRPRAVDGFAVVDPEPPQGVMVTYVAEMFDAAGGSLGFLASHSVILDRELMGNHYGKVWVHNVLEPSGAVEWTFSGDALSELTERNPGGLYSTEGNPDPVWMGGATSGLRGVNLSGSTYTLEDADRFRAMFGTREDPKVPILVFRGPPELLLPGTFFAAITERSRLPQNVAWGGGEWVRWALTGDEVAPPFPGLSEPVLTWDDVEAAYTTAAQLEAAYARAIDLERDYSLAGLANN